MERTQKVFLLTAVIVAFVATGLKVAYGTDVQTYTTGSGVEIYGAGTSAFDISTQPTTGGAIYIYSRSAGTGIVVDTANNVGIGTASPGQKLDVAGTVAATQFNGSGAGLTAGSIPISAHAAGDYSGKITSGSYSISVTGGAGSVPWSGVSGKPTTVGGYGITDMGSQSVNYANSAGSASGVAWSSVSSKPTAITRVQDLTGSYGSLNIGGTTNGYAGINFVDEGSTFMVDLGGATGMYRNTGSWQWYFDANGVLTVGSVPWSLISSKPTAVSAFTNDSNYVAANSSPTFAAVTVSAAPTNGTNLTNRTYTDTTFAPLNGTGANGTWGINITGSAGSANSVAWGNVSGRPGWLNGGSYVDSHSNANEWRNSGFYENGGCGTNWPSCTWYNSLNVRHSNQGNYHGFQVAMSYYDNLLWYRSYQGSGTFQPWVYAISSGNIGSQSVNYANSAGSAGSVPWSGVSGKPTTVAGYGITDMGSQSVSYAATAGNANQLISKNWYWSGQSGQPTWLWGGSDGTNMYVYNPSNFSVNYANSAGSAGSAGSVAWGNVSGRPTTVSAFTNDSGYITNTNSNYYVTSGNGNALCFWQDCTNYKIHMGTGAEYQYGPVTDYSIKTNMNSTAGRGWTWGQPGTTPVAALNNAGVMQIAGGMTASQFSGSGAGLTAGSIPISAHAAGDYSGKITSGSYSISVTGSAGSVPWSGVSGKPTTVAGYGITDMGSQSVSYANSAGNVSSLSGTWWGTNYFGSNKGASSYVGSNSTYGLEAYSSDAGAAGMSFHRGGYYAVNMGLDPDNVLRIGGWSAAANRWQLDMSGNETIAGAMTATQFNGSGAGLTGTASSLTAGAANSVAWVNVASKPTTVGGYGITDMGSQTVSNSDMADGLHVHGGRNNEANKIVRTDGNGYIQAGWINTDSGDNGTTGIARVYASQDGYIRYYTMANFSAQVTPSWSNISGRPTVPANQDGGRYTTDYNSLLATGFYNGEATPANAPNAYGQLITARGIDTGLQVAGGYNSDNLYFRGWWSSGAGFSSWRTVLHNGNYNSYAPTLTGGGANGTWGISITGSAGSVPWSGISSKPTTVGGYGITDMGSQSVNYANSAGSVTNGVYTTSANRWPLSTWMYASGAGTRNWYIAASDMYWELGGNGSFHFRNSSDVDVATISYGGVGAFAAGTTVGGVNVCLSNGTNCPAATGIGGSGTAAYIPKFTAGTTLGNSLIYDNGTNVGIGTTSPGYKLDVAGDIRAISAWLRTTGNTGWYSDTYGGGWYMQDTSWIRSYNSKSLWVDTGLLGSNGGLTVGYGGTGSPSGGAIISGSVGIGNSSPGYKLDVTGNARISASASQLLLTNNAGGSSITFNSHTDNSLYVYPGTNGGYHWQLGTNTNGSSFDISKNDWTRILVVNGDGNVGIGTTSPSDQLEVRTPGHTTGMRVVNNISGTGIELQGFQPAVFFNNYYDGSGQRAIGNGYTGGIVMNASDSGLMMFSTGNNPGAGNAATLSTAMTIANSGTVGIGIGVAIAPYPLTVSGTIAIAGTGNGLRFPDGTTQTTAATGGGGSIGGSGTTGYVPKFTNGTTLGNSLMSDNGAVVNVAGHMALNSSIVTTYLNLGSNSKMGYIGMSGMANQWFTGGEIGDLAIRSDNGKIKLGAGTTAGITINTSNNVGIGTMAPAAKLHVMRPNGEYGITYPTLTLDYNGTAFGKMYMDANWYLNILNEKGDQGGISFGTNNITGRMVITTAGNVGIGTTAPSYTLQVGGSFSVSGYKNFDIPHPAKPGYRLVHSTLEGPEVGVYYRGHGKLAGGVTIIQLPSYFDALTRDGSESVLLTGRGKIPFVLSFDDFDKKAGTFKVYGTIPDGEFDWEVKAVRADLSPLKVERKDGEAPSNPTPSGVVQNGAPSRDNANLAASIASIAAPANGRGAGFWKKLLSWSD